MGQRFACKEAGMEKCDFAVESSSEDELVKMAKRHAREMHDMEISRQDVLDASKRARKAKR